MKRRSYLEKSAIATGLSMLPSRLLAADFPSIIPSSVLGKEGVAPSGRVSIGAIACGDQSGANNNYVHYDKAEVVAVCDPVRERRDNKALHWGNVQHKYSDFRDLLARDDIDAVHIATPDHWHVPIAMAAARAGKDLYVEKPLGLSIDQCLQAGEITRKHGRIFQYGTQQRSQTHLRLGIELVLNGHIGDVKEIIVWCPGGTSGGPNTPEIPVPDGFDFELWTGPAPKRPFTQGRCLPKRGQGKAAYFNNDYSIGFIAGWGAHPVDQLQWWADAAGMGIPVKYKTTGQIPTPDALYNTATSWIMESQYANGIKVCFMDTKTMHSSNRVPHKDKVGNFGNCTMFMGTKGWVAVSRAGWVTSSDGIRRTAKDPGSIRLVKSVHHQRNFVDCVLNREQPVSTLESAIQSDIICHLGDIGIRTGEEIGWDPVRQMVLGSEAAVARMKRPLRTPWTL